MFEVDSVGDSSCSSMWLRVKDVTHLWDPAWGAEYQMLCQGCRLGASLPTLKTYCLSWMVQDDMEQLQAALEEDYEIGSAPPPLPP